MIDRHLSSVTLWLMLLLVEVPALAGPPPASGVGPGGGGGLAPPPADCVTPAERAWADAAVRRYAAGDGPRPGPPARFTFYPLAGTLYEALYTNNFVDLDPTGSLLDWNCTNHTYDGHRGNDTDIRSFGEQEVGVPVYAALDGTVVATHDGEFDMNTSCVGIANSVIIDHGAGRLVYYWHLRNGSVAVEVGQEVRAGEQIGLCASSGCSTYPHLHFEVRDGGGVVEPYAGPCREGESAWVDQEPIRWDTYLRDLGITHENLAFHPGLPFTLPRTGQIETSDPLTRVWFIVHNLPAFSAYRWQFVRPNGTVARTSSGNWNNSAAYRWSWWWFSHGVADMHEITGTWRIRLDINGSQVAEVPVEVVTERDPDFNRAPAPIAAALEPRFPIENEVIIARLASDLVLDDVDYDIVRYRYEWAVDGQTVRDVVTAGRADVLPAGTATIGQVVRCTITPSDGRAAAPPASDEVTIQSDCLGDVDESGTVDVADVLRLLASWGSCPECPADVDGSGVVDVADLLIVLAAWGPCDTLGACCLPTSGECLRAPAAGCAALGGVYQGDGSTCGGGACDNDHCTGAIAVGEGVFAYTTRDATDEGPALPPECDEGGGLLFRRDVWFRYTAACNGVASVRVCDSTFDTRLAVYAAGGPECPGAFIACNDDACGDGGTRSSLSFPVAAGEQYLVRIGARFAIGEGTLVIECAE